MKEKPSKLLLLTEAVNRGDLSRVRHLIESGVNLNAKSSEGLTALFCAIESSYPKIALALIEAGADINTKDQRGHSALIAAIRRQQHTVVDALLERGADIFVRTRGNMTALGVAAAIGSIESISKLVAYGSDINASNSEIIMIAVSYKQTDTVKHLIALGSNPNTYSPEDGRTLLMISSLLGDEKTAKVLLQADVNIEAKDDRGLTAYDIAYEEDHKKLVSILKKRRLDRN